MAGEAGSLGRAFVEIHVPVAAFQAQMGAVGASFTSTTGKMGVQGATTSTAIVAGNAKVAKSYQATALSAKGLMTMMKSALPIMAAFMAIQKTLGIAGGAVSSQREFNKELYQLWTLTDLTAGGIEDLGEEIRGLVYDYNVFAAAGTKAMYQIYSATFYGAEATEILTQGMKAAAAGVTDVMSAVDMTTTVLNAYGMAASEATRVNDLLFTAVRYGKTTYEELAGQFGRLAGVAAPAGARLEEMTAAIATLTRQGIATDWAVTSLRQTIMSMFRPTGALAGVIKSLGYETGRSLIQQNGFVGALKLVKEKADATGIPLENLFTNVRAITAVLPLLTTASEGFALDMERTAMATGTMDIAFAKVEQSWDYRIERLKSQLNDLGISIGESLIPAMESFLKVWASLAGGIEGVIDLLGPLGEMIAQVAGQMAGGATAAGVLAGGIWLVYKALMALNAHPVIAGISVAVTMLGMLANKWGDIAKETDDATDAIDRYMKKRALFEGGGNEPEGTAGDVPAGTLGERLDEGGSIPMGATLNWIKSLSAGRMIYDTPVGADITPQISQIATILIKEIETRMNAWMASDVSTPGTIDQNELKIIHDVLTTSATVMGPLEEADFAQEVAAAFGVELSEVLSNDPLWGMIGEGIKVGETFGGLEGQRSPSPGFTNVPAGTLATIDEINQARAEADQTLLSLLNDAALVIEPNITQFKMSLYEASKEFEALWISIQNGTVVVGEGESEMDAYLGAWEDMNSILETSKDWLEKISGVEDINEEDMAFLDSIIEFMQAVVGEESTFITETRALIKEYEAAGEGTVRQAELIQKLSGSYSTAIGLQEALALVGIKADASLLKIIEDTYKFKDATEDLSESLQEAIKGIADIAVKLATTFGGEKGDVWGAGASFVGEGASLIGSLFPGIAGIMQWFPLINAGIDLLLAAWNHQERVAEEKQAEEDAASQRVIASAKAAAEALWNLVESAESVAEIQSGLAQLQVNIMSSLLAWLWPLAGILGYINDLFVIQADSIEKEVTAREKMLSNLNVPIGFPINRIRYAAGTPGEPVTFNEDEIGDDAQEQVEALLTWWEEALEPFRDQILKMIQPIADFRDAMQDLAVDLIPAMLQILEPILDTFGWTLGEISTWMQEVFKPDFEEFAEGFATFWTDKVDPFWEEDMFPQLTEWFNTLYGWLGDILDFFGDEGWDFLSGPVWERVKGFVDTVLDMFQEFGEWIDENWDDISDNLLDVLSEVLGDIVGDLDTVLDNIKNWLLGTEIDDSEMSDWQWLMSAISFLLNFLREALDFVVDAFQFFGNILGQVMNAIIWPFNAFIDLINSALGWAGVDIPNIPYFDWIEAASGGIVTSATPLIAGEEGPEAIIPLNQLANMLSTQPSAAGMAGVGGFGGGVGSSAITINVNLSQERLSQIMIRKMTSQNVNDHGVGFAPIRLG